MGAWKEEEDEGENRKGEVAQGSKPTGAVRFEWAEVEAGLKRAGRLVWLNGAVWVEGLEGWVGTGDADADRRVRDAEREKALEL